MPQNKSVGLFLGAGASFELGMPLVWDLTGEFKGYFTSDHLRELNAGWLRQGGGYDNSVIETTIALLMRDDLHYENILGYLQTVVRRAQQAFAEQYDGMYKRMVEAIYLLLYHRQVGSLPYIMQGLPPFEGLSGFVKKSSPVWVFSLNHDLILQLLAVHCGIPFRDGFWPEKTLTVAGNQPNAPKDSLLADVLSEEDLNSGKLHLFKPGETGMNLIRLHGALDIFTFRDGLDLCRVRPAGSELNGTLAALRVVNEEIGYWDRSGKARVVNELPYTDEAGQEQFLRRTLLAGAQKFDKRFSQTLPQKMLDIFRSYINYVQKLSGRRPVATWRFRLARRSCRPPSETKARPGGWRCRPPRCSHRATVPDCGGMGPHVPCHLFRAGGPSRRVKDRHWGDSSAHCTRCFHLQSSQSSSLSCGLMPQRIDFTSSGFTKTYGQHDSGRREFSLITNSLPSSTMGRGRKRSAPPSDA